MTLKQHDIDPIFLLAPTSTDERIQSITAAASGYVYYVSLKGVTGSNTLDVDAVAERVATIRRFSDLPIGGVLVLRMPNPPLLSLIMPMAWWLDRF